MAAELLRAAAAREAAPGHAFPPEDERHREFADAFPFDPTPDQQGSWERIRAEMERPRPMDWLLCGDVGYGKTEVALRAAFLVASGGRQAAVLVPTTVLAEQHRRTFEARLAPYPLTVRALSRFRTPAETREILAGLADGSVDVVVGTHRLLSKDVRFRDLGLVVVDEEQRFGVAQKEKLKELRTSVDVLSMNRFQESLRSLIVGRIFLPCIFGRFLVLVLPFALDQHNHDVGSIESSQTHSASWSDLAPLACVKAEIEILPRSPEAARDGSRLPTKRFFITSASSSYL